MVVFARAPARAPAQREMGTAGGDESEADIVARKPQVLQIPTSLSLSVSAKPRV